MILNHTILGVASFFNFIYNNTLLHNALVSLYLLGVAINTAKISYLVVLKYRDKHSEICYSLDTHDFFISYHTIPFVKLFFTTPKIVFLSILWPIFINIEFIKTSVNNIINPDELLTILNSLQKLNEELKTNTYMDDSDAVYNTTISQILAEHGIHTVKTKGNF